MKKFFRLLKTSVLIFAIIAFCGCGVDLDPCTFSDKRRDQQRRLFQAVILNMSHLSTAG